MKKFFSSVGEFLRLWLVGARALLTNGALVVPMLITAIMAPEIDRFVVTTISVAIAMLYLKAEIFEHKQSEENAGLKRRIEELEEIIDKRTKKPS